MAGWADSGGSRGRGGGGGGGCFINRGAANNTNNNNNTRWRERRPPSQQQHSHHHQQQPPHNQQQQQQPHNHQQHQHNQHQHQHNHQQQRYRPVNDNDHSSQPPHDSPLEELGRQQGQQGSSSTSRRRPRPQPTRAPPTFTGHNSPTSAANANANEPDDKARRNAANFECNVCFEMADNPVVTKCGHLFCWECLYQWIHIHSNHRECPVCKGQVADDAIIPIYGRGGSAASVHDAPPRPTGARVESSRQQQLQQQAAMDDDEYDNPFDLQEIRLGFGASSLGDAMMSFIDDDVDVEQLYDDYTNPNRHHHHDFDEVYDYALLGLPMLPSVGARTTRRHQHHTAVSDDIMETFFDNNMTTYPDIYFGNRGGRSRRGRARGASSPLGVVMGSSLEMGGSVVSYRSVGDDPPPSTGGSSRPNGGWTERRGRSNRNSNSGGGRGMQNSRRQGTHHN